MKDKLLIIGASGHGKVVADIALKMNRWKTISFIDDNQEIKSSLGLKVIGGTANISAYINEYDIFVGIGNNALRKRFQDELEKFGASIPIIIHPSAVIGTKVEFGKGTVIMAGVVINCCTKIGRGSIINTCASVDHDNKIDEFVHLSPGVHLAGNVNIGKGTWVGIGSVVINNITVTSKSIIGAGAVVVGDICEKGTYIGVPARRV